MFLSYPNTSLGLVMADQALLAVVDFVVLSPAACSHCFAR